DAGARPDLTPEVGIILARGPGGQRAGDDARPAQTSTRRGFGQDSRRDANRVRARSDWPGSAQSAHQRAAGDRGLGPPGGWADRGRGPPDPPLGRDLRARQRSRHRAGTSRAAVRSFLHDQARGRRHGAGTGDQSRHHFRPWRPDRGREPTGRGELLPGPAAATPSVHSAASGEFLDSPTPSSMTGRESRDTIVYSKAPSFRIEALGALVWAEPGFTAAVVPGAGLWSVSLFVHPWIRMPPQRGRVPLAEGLTSIMARTKHCLLIVDDEPNVCDSVHDLLRREFHVLKALSADEGYRLMQEEEVHIVMSDQRMPQISGVELLTKVKARYPQAIRMLFTGFADLESVIASINQGHISQFVRNPGSPKNSRWLCATRPRNTTGWRRSLASESNC